MKYVFTNQNFYKSKLNFLKKDTYVNKETLQVFDIFYLV